MQLTIVLQKARELLGFAELKAAPPWFTHCSFRSGPSVPGDPRWY